MDTRKMRIKSLSKTGIYYILFGAIFSALFSVLSLFVKFNVTRQSSVTILFFFLSLVLFVSFYIALSQFEDPSKMLLEFHPPKSAQRAEIQSVSESIHMHYSKNCKLKYAVAYPLASGLILFGIAHAVMNPYYFFYHLKDVLINTFVFPPLFLGIISFFICRIICRNRIDEIRDGAYAVTEVTLVEKYYCVHSGARHTFTDYFIILADSHGNKGRFKVIESEYFRFHADNTILLVKRSKGKLFYNAMEPVVITEQYRPTIDI